MTTDTNPYTRNLVLTRELIEQSINPVRHYDSDWLTSLGAVDMEFKLPGGFVLEADIWGGDWEIVFRDYDPWHPYTHNCCLGPKPTKADVLALLAALNFKVKA